MYEKTSTTKHKSYPDLNHVELKDLSESPSIFVEDYSDSDANSYSHLEYDFSWHERKKKAKLANSLISLLSFLIIFAMCFVIMYTLKMSDMIDEKVRQKYRYEYSSNIILTVMTNTSTVILDTNGIDSWFYLLYINHSIVNIDFFRKL